MTVRAYIEEARRILLLPPHAERVAGAYERLTDALVELNNSREITEKVTTRQKCCDIEDHGMVFVVANHKARVVLDD